jgi:hypothetical protein
MQTNRIFYGAVAAALHLIDCNVVDYKMGFEQFACGFGQIGHVGKMMGTFAPQPFVHLVSAKSLIALGNKKFAELFFATRADIFFGFGHAANLTTIC